MAPPVVSQVTVLFSDSTSVVLPIPAGIDYSDFAMSIAAKGCSPGLVFYPSAQIKSITAS